MDARFSLSYLTAPVEDPFEAAEIARCAGYDHLGLRLRHPDVGGAASPLVGDRVIRADFVRRLADDGLSVIEIEAWMLLAGQRPGGDEAIFAAAAEIGQPRLIVVGDGAGRMTIEEMCDQFAAVCEQAAAYGLGVGFEPIAHRAGGDLQSALRVTAAGAPWQAGIVLDTLHIRRMGLSSSQLRAVDRSLIHAIHLCDAPLEARDPQAAIDHSAFNRSPPGEGELPLKDYLRDLPPDRPISLEVPMVRLAGKVTPLQRARMAIEGARNILSQV